MSPLTFAFLLLLLLSLSHTDAVCVPRISAPYDFTPKSTNFPKSSKTPPPSSSTKSPTSSSEQGSADTEKVGNIIGSVANYCKQTDYKDVCLSSVQGLLPNFGANVNAKNLLELQTKALKTKIEGAIDKATKFLSDPKFSSFKRYIKNCIDDYKETIEDYEEVTTSLQSGDKDTVDTDLSSFITSFGDCEDSFTDSFLNSPMAGINDELTRMTSNCLALSDLAFPDN